MTADEYIIIATLGTYLFILLLEKLTSELIV